MALGTHQGYLEGEELREVMDGMADTFFRLEKLYRARKAEGLSEDNDVDTKLIRGSLERMEIACHILASFVQTDTLVADAAIKPFYEYSAEAARVLQAEGIAAAETIH